MKHLFGGRFRLLVTAKCRPPSFTTKLRRPVTSNRSKEGINLIQMITVPSAPEALRAAEKIPESGTITTAELAEQTFGQGNYNLIPLPEKFISIANAISYRVTADRDTVNLVDQLRLYFEQHTGKLTADATTN